MPTKNTSEKKTAAKPVKTADSAKSEKKSKEKNTGMAIVAYILFFVPLLTDSKDDPFVKFHVKQGLVLFILMIATMFIGIIPVIGWLIALVAPLFIFILFIIGVINAANGKEKELPLVGQFAEKFDF